MKNKIFMPQGVEDTHYNQFEIKENATASFKDICKVHGYRQVLTPTLEYYDLFTDGTIHKDNMFKLIDGDGKILVLRPDVTTPIARMVATNYKEASGYLKFSYVSNVFRINDEQSGNKREFVQGGIENIGDCKPDSDAEVISLAIKNLLNWGINEFKIDLGHAGFLKSATDVKITMEDKKHIFNLIENKNQGELCLLLENLNISEDIKKKIIQLPFLYGRPKDVLEKAESLVWNDRMHSSLQNLKEVYSILCEYGYEQYISVDLGMNSHINYYTGLIFKGYVSRYGKAVLSGGRYDDLSSHYGHHLPATGFGINIDELLEAMKMFGLKEELKCFTDYLILYDEETRKSGFELASTLRSKGFIVESDKVQGDMKMHILNASSRNIREILQISEGKVKVIDLRGNQLYACTLSQFVNKLNLEDSWVSIH